MSLSIDLPFDDPIFWKCAGRLLNLKPTSIYDSVEWTVEDYVESHECAQLILDALSYNTLHIGEYIRLQRLEFNTNQRQLSSESLNIPKYDILEPVLKLKDLIRYLKPEAEEFKFAFKFQSEYYTSIQFDMCIKLNFQMFFTRHRSCYV